MDMWAEKFFCRFSGNYLIYSLGITLSIFFLYLLLSAKVRFLFLTSYNMLSLASTSILMGYQFALITYLFSNVKTTFDRIMPLFRENGFVSLQNELKMWLGNKGTLNRTILLVIMPFMLLEIIRFWQWKYSEGKIPLYFSLFDPSSHWAFLLDVINHILEYLMYVMLAITVWFVIGLTKNIGSLKKDPAIKIDVFHADGMGGLKPVQGFMLMVVINYFIIIALAIVSFISPRSVVSYETVFLLILLLLGIYLFVVTMSTTKTLMDRAIGGELDRIDDRYRMNYERLLEMTSQEKYEWEEKEMEKLQLAMEFLEKEENRIRQIHDKNSSKKAISAFIGSFLIPSLTLAEDLTGMSAQAMVEWLIKHLLWS
ncbi:hypothetical protein [Methanomethylovorans sp.]|uniref:hypothetical protein n=1 Tax=Methanomethylovorans sp. TaxID=2758717 RepID=UPI003D0AD81F